jgi:hypothetical protein
MKTLLTLLVVILATTHAFAVIDPDPDMLGIYFDQAADNMCMTVGVNTPFYAYLILTNPTAPGITAYEFGLDVVVPAGMEGLFFRLSDSPFWYVPFPPAPPPPLGGDYAIGLASTYPTEPATILHVWQYMLLATFPVEIFLRANSNPSIPGELPVIKTGEVILMQVGFSTGGPGVPVATVNAAECPVVAEEVSFGMVKALYR